MAAAYERTLDANEIAGFIAAIPNLTAQWKPPNQVRRKRIDEIAARVAEAFQEAGITCVTGWEEDSE